MQEERKMILKMIEDGKITAEEGLQLLNALKDDKKEEVKEEPSQTHTYQHSEEHALSKDVDWDGGSTYHHEERKSPSFAARFSEFIEEAIQKIKEFDLDFNFGSSVEIDHIFQHQENQIEKVDVSVENGSITFRPWNERDVRIESQVKVYKVRDADEARRTFLDVVNFYVHDGKLKFNSPRKSMKVNVVVYVPKDHLEKVKLYTFNGKISGDDVLTTESFEAQTVNGRIDFEALKTKDARLETVNGTISIDKLESVHCDAKTVNGTINVGAIEGKFDGETLNGTINYTLLQPSNGRAYAKTTTGSIIVNVPENVKTEGELKTTVGGMNCTLPDMAVIEEKKEFANKKMAFLANKNGEYSFYIEAEATTGTITIGSNQ